jgi:hypothetical protein
MLTELPPSPQPGGAALPEPWLRGALPDVDPLLAPALRSFEQVREDLAHHTGGITDHEIWLALHGLAPLGFQLRHIAGSVDRLTTYLAGGSLSPAQLADLAAEMEPRGSRADLLDAVDHALRRSEFALRALDPARLHEPRTVGRLALPTTAIGLVVHLAEHTQRHLGQAILTAKLVRSARAASRP